jgi:hypothetical protein
MTAAQRAVYDVLNQYGPMPDHALVPLAQHAANIHYSSSGIRSRRKELCDRGKVRDTGERIKMPSGRYAAVYSTVKEGV